MTQTLLHQRALDLELAGLTIVQIAKELKRSTRTIYSWRQTAAYQTARRQLITRTHDAALARLNALTTKAIRKLEELLEATKVSASGEESPATPTQLAAAKEILNRTFGSTESEGEQLTGQLTLQLPPSGFRK